MKYLYNIIELLDQLSNKDQYAILDALDNLYSLVEERVPITQNEAETFDELRDISVEIKDEMEND